MSKYSLADGLYLHTDGTMTVCIKTNPVPVPRQVKSNIQTFGGTVQDTIIDWKRFSCTTKCPFFDLQTDEAGKITGTLHCMEVPRELKDIEPFRIPAKNSGEKPVKLEIHKK